MVWLGVIEGGTGWWFRFEATEVAPPLVGLVGWWDYLLFVISTTALRTIQFYRVSFSAVVAGGVSVLPVGHACDQFKP